MTRTKIVSLVALFLFAVPFITSAAALTEAHIQSVLAVLSSFGADADTVTSVNAALRDQTTSGSAARTCVSLTRNLSAGSTDATTSGEVSQLQQFLGISPTTGYFGPLTEKAVKDWQSSHGIVSSGTPDTTGYGFVGPTTRTAMSCSTGGVTSSSTSSSSAQSTTQTQQTTTSSLAPTVSSVSTAEQSGGLLVTVIGTNFQPGASIVLGASNSLLPTIYKSSTTLTTGPSAYNPGVYNFFVKNPDGQMSRSSASVTVGQSTATTITSGGYCTPGSGSGSTVSTSYSGPIPTSCFGRTVIPHIVDDVTGAISGELKYPNGFAMEPNKMHITRFKTDDVGYTIGMMGWITDVNVAGSSGETLGFISSTPCDYTGAYNNGLVARGDSTGGGWAMPKSTTLDLPVLADNQVQTYFDNWIATNAIFFGQPLWYVKDINRKAYLKPNTYYYLNIINASGGWTDTMHPAYKTDADLTTSPDTCINTNASGYCSYELIRINPHKYPPVTNSTPGNLIPGLPAPTTGATTPPPTCTPPVTPPACTTSTTTTTPSLKWWSSAEFYNESVAKCEDVGYANVVHGQSCSSEGYKCRKTLTNSTKMNLFQCQMSSTTGTTTCTPPPTTTPPLSCGAGEVFNTATGDRDWTAETGMHTIQSWPVPAVTGTGDLGRAIRFVADNAKYPLGVQLVGWDETGSSRDIPKDYVVSECPHSFVPVAASSFEGRQLCTVLGSASVAGPFYLRFGPAKTRTVFGSTFPTLDCPLTPNRTYYINFRSSITPRGTVSSQFTTYDRAAGWE